MTARAGIGGATITGFAAQPGEPLSLSGDAYERGRGQAGGVRPDGLAAVRAATVERTARARADGLIDADAEDYLRAQYAFHRTHDPESVAELRGIAAGLGLSEPDLFAHLHLSLLQVGRSKKPAGADGCSTWAVAEGPEGPLIAKNRDISSPDVGVPFVSRHAGPGISTDEMICVGSIGNPAAYSSGVNARGFALADTHVLATEPRVGWLRYFLMTRLLASCASVAEALAMIRAAPHAGGGTLILADASGALAAVEFDKGVAFVTEGSLVWRTNHFLSPAGADEAVEDDAIGSSSCGRYAVLKRALPPGRWTVAAAAHLMAGHRTDGAAAASLCQHPDTDGSRTLSCAIYACRTGTLTYSAGNPCRGPWSTYRAGASGASPTPAVPA